ncbi:MAG: hypothetical protein HN344_10855, partial [Gammaproteobacteria bacterium]|nr:hypothetical protein [Gammaproteobacteria bacterium]
MILIFTSLLLFILLSRVFEHALKIPTTLSLLLLSFFVNQYYPDFITLS